MLTGSVAGQLFQSVSRWHAKCVERGSAVELLKFAFGYRSKVGVELDSLAREQVSGVLVGEGSNHGFMVCRLPVSGKNVWKGLLHIRRRRWVRQLNDPSRVFEKIKKP
jgi:hypothetical protein